MEPILLSHSKVSPRTSFGSGRSLHKVSSFTLEDDRTYSRHRLKVAFEFGLAVAYVMLHSCLKIVCEFER